MLAVAAIAAALLLLGGPAAFAADGIEQCLVSEVNAAGASLASTGAGIDVQTWLMGGIALLAVGATLAIVAPGRRRESKVLTVDG